MKTYLIVCEATGLVKIGKGANPVKRLSTLQVGSTSKLSIAHVFDCDIEKSLHERFRDNREVGEWFSISIEDVLDYVNQQSLEEITTQPKKKLTNGIFKSVPRKNLTTQDGAPIKHKWIRTMNVGDVCKIPDGMKPNAIRCFCYQYGLERSQKYQVSISKKTVTRIA